MCRRRLQKECVSLRKSPVEYISCHPLDSDILQWHYVITGPPDSPYEGGKYHGKLKFPTEYPLKPPSVIMFTPSGRFKPARKLCLSMSDFHPESWNPMWSVSTILTGLFSFMLDNAPTLGSIETTLAEKKRLAKASMSFNVKDKLFTQVFPELTEEFYAKQEADGRKIGASERATITTEPAAPGSFLQRLASMDFTMRNAEEFMMLTILAGVIMSTAIKVFL